MRGTTHTPDESREFGFNDDNFLFISNLVNSHSGIVFAENKRNMVYSRLTKRLRHFKMQTFDEYCAFLQTDAGLTEIENCLNALTTNLTGFFRENHHFDHLHQLLSKIAAHPPADKRLRIWSSASSSGQEPYSIAMTMADAMANSLRNWDAKILATDIDTNMVATSAAGVYPNDQLSKIPPQYRSKFEFEPSKERPGHFTMPDSIRKFLTFKQLNLLKDWPMKGPFDVVFCRNVVIYFDKPTQEVLFDRMAELMKPDGILYIGHSESIHKICDRFRLIGKTTYQRIK